MSPAVVAAAAAVGWVYLSSVSILFHVSVYTELLVKPRISHAKPALLPLSSAPALFLVLLPLLLKTIYSVS